MLVYSITPTIHYSIENKRHILNYMLNFKNKAHILEVWDYPIELSSRFFTLLYIYNDWYMTIVTTWE